MIEDEKGDGRGPESGEFLSRRHFGSLDGLRGLGVLAVVWHHTERLSWPPAAHRGFLGVDMFFVISGFLIVTLLLRERSRVGDVSLKRFYIRRSLRIFPVYYGLLAALSLVFAFKARSRVGAQFFGELPYLVTYTANWIHSSTFLAIAWSLAAEEQFYLLWPPVEKWLSRLAVPILLLVIAINQVINFAVASGRASAWFGRDVGTLGMLQITFTPICLGVLLAHVMHSGDGFRRVARVLGPPWVPVALLAAVVASCNLPIRDYAGWPRLALQSLMTLLLASCVIREDHGLRGLLSFPTLRRIGVVSYGIYLYHVIVLVAVNAILARVPVRFPFEQFVLVALGTWGIAELSYRYFEAPFLRLKETLGRRPAAPVAVAPPGEIGPQAVGLGRGAMVHPVD